MKRHSARAEAASDCGIGAPLPRLEDERFLTGCGRFVDDLSLSGMAFAYVLRAPHAHARILRIDTSQALTSPQVLLVLSGADIAQERIGGLPCAAFPTLPEGARAHRPLQPILAIDKVRYVGEAVALVVAESPNAARDAAERIVVEYVPLRAATLADALAPDAPKVFDEAPSSTRSRSKDTCTARSRRAWDKRCSKR
jgi:carbon-monoxide dehydrogenase large subunit